MSKMSWNPVLLRTGLVIALIGSTLTGGGIRLILLDGSFSPHGCGAP
ncbi:MAG TPA: hypothetical protein VEZ24_07565 [Microvirga sp.]|nr:hypothetical protein [Microvirga sp.]